MSEDISLGEIHRILLEVRADVKAQNGKVLQNSLDIAVLKDRESDARKDARNNGAGFGALTGGLIAGFLWALHMLFGIGAAK